MSGIRVSLLLALFALSACHGEARSLERQYEMMEKSGASLREKCRMARKVQDAWMAAESDSEFRQWKLTADIMCGNADAMDAIHMMR